jgi:hypothetical protein
MNSVLLFVLDLVPPWTLMAAVIGMASGALFSLLCGRSLRHLPIYVLGGAVVGAVSQPASAATGYWWGVGEVSIPLAVGAVWLALGVARVVRL